MNRKNTLVITHREPHWPMDGLNFVGSEPSDTLLRISTNLWLETKFSMLQPSLAKQTSVEQVAEQSIWLTQFIGGAQLCLCQNRATNYGLIHGFKDNEMEGACCCQQLAPNWPVAKNINCMCERTCDATGAPREDEGEELWPFVMVPVHDVAGSVRIFHVATVCCTDRRLFPCVGRHWWHTVHWATKVGMALWQLNRGQGCRRVRVRQRQR